MINRNPFRTYPSKERQHLGPGLVASGSVLLVVVLSLLFVGIPQIIKYFVTQETRLVEGSETWKKWEEVKIPVFMMFYFFNVTNPDEAEKGSKFILNEIGPYVWEEKRKKTILEQNEEEDSVTYRERTHFYFRRDMSIGSDEDVLDVVNVPFIVASGLVYHHIGFVNYLGDYLMDSFINDGETVVSRGVKVKDVAFNGVPILEALANFADFFGIELPEEIYNGTFAVFNNKNGTLNNSYKVNRGIKDYRRFGSVMGYNGKPELDWWTNSSLPQGAQQYCNKLNGTDVNIFPPFITRNTRLYGFHHEICRSIYAVFDKDVNYEGIPAYRFVLPPMLIESVENNPDNVCFCQPPPEGLNQECLKGTIRMATCKRDAPLLLSKPHFLDGDPILLQNVSGLNPDRAKHDSELIIEPITGALLRISCRIQVNVEYQRIPGVDAFADVQPAYVPLAWVNEIAAYNDEQIQDFRNRLILPLSIVTVIMRVLISIFAIMILVGICMMVF